MLTWARLQAGLTQRELAVRTHTAQSTISRIESGQMDPSVGTMSRLLRGCGYDLGVEPSLDDLNRMKKAAGRPKDKIALEILGALRDQIDEEG